MTTSSSPPAAPHDGQFAFDGLLASVSWTSPPLRVSVDTVPGYDWNAALTLAARQLIGTLFDEADSNEFIFDVTAIADEPSLAVADDGPARDVFIDDEDSADDRDSRTCYFAGLAGTVTWTNSGIWVGVTFRPGEDWRSNLRAYALEEAVAWTHETAEYDVDFRMHMDCRINFPN